MAKRGGVTPPRIRLREASSLYDHFFQFLLIVRAGFRMIGSCKQASFPPASG
jgi:hypothetical protein